VKLIKNPKFLFLLLFLISNIYSFIHYYINGNFLGEVSQFEYNNKEAAMYILILILFFYCFFMVFLYRSLIHIRINPLISNLNKVNWNRSEGFWGWFVIFIQTLFIIYFTFTGSFGANSTNREGSIISAFWVLISPDNLFFIYYCVFRKSKLAKYNCALAVLSNILRGWSSIFIFILFIELCHRYREGRLRIGVLAKFALILFLLYPFILVIKYSIRDSLALGQSFTSVLSITWSYIFNNEGLLGYLNGLIFGLDQFFSRIQIFSNATVLFSLKDQISTYIDAHAVNSFWNEGIYGLIWDRIIGNPSANNLGEVFAYFIDPQSILGSWNSNPTFLSWIFIYPFEIGAYLIFVIMLCFLTVLLIKKITSEELANDMIWYMWLILILPGWFASFILLLNTLFLFYIITLFKLSGRSEHVCE